MKVAEKIVLFAEHRIRMGSTNGKPGLAKEDIINFVKITGMNEDQVEKFFVRINEVKVSFTGHPVILNLI